MLLEIPISINFGDKKMYTTPLNRIVTDDRPSQGVQIYNMAGDNITKEFPYAMKDLQERVDNTAFYEFWCRLHGISPEFRNEVDRIMQEMLSIRTQ